MKIFLHYIFIKIYSSLKIKMAKIQKKSIKKKEIGNIFRARVIKNCNKKVLSSCVECGKATHKASLKNGTRNLTEVQRIFFNARGINTKVYKKICLKCRLQFQALKKDEYAYLNAVKTTSALLSNSKLDDNSFFDSKDDEYLKRVIGLTKNNFFCVYSILVRHQCHLNSKVKLIDALGFYLAKYKLGKKYFGKSITNMKI